MKKITIFLIAFLFLSLLFVPVTRSQTQDDLNKEIAELQEKLKELSQTKNTLKNQIAYLDSQVSLTEYQIKQTELQIRTLEVEILDLSEKISVLDLNLDQISATFLTRVAQSYKLHKKTPVLWFLSGKDFNDSLQKFKYYHTLQLNDRETLLAMEEIRMNHDLQKQKKEEKQQELEVLNQTLAQQKINLANQKASKNQLLITTQNDEKTYQSLLAQAQAELASLKRFASSQGGDICLGSPQSQPDGWFWSQRDSRWCNQIIGNSTDDTDTIGAVGCLISSVAMIWQKHGHSKDPPSIAQNPSFFVLNTAYMSTPPAPPGYNYHRYNYYNSDMIDSELAADRPVIVHLNIGGDGHFVVLKSGSGGNYIMNDPWYGPDIPLTDHYSVGSINSMRIFKP